MGSGGESQEYGRSPRVGWVGKEQPLWRATLSYLIPPLSTIITLAMSNRRGTAQAYPAENNHHLPRPYNLAS